MSLPMLPAELIDAVCENLAPADLARLSYTGSLVLRGAQRQLYRHVAIAPSRRNLSVVLTLARKPDIARHVRSFSIDLDSHYTLLRPFYQQLSHALSRMTEITSLHLFVDSAASWVLEKCCGSRLLHFSCPFPLDSHVATFLRRTPELLELEVDSIPFRHEQPAPSALTLSSIPLLQQFLGSSQAAQVVVPSRPVHTVQLTAGDLTEAVVSNLSESASNITALSATTGSAPSALLQSISQQMQSLVHLRLMTTYSFPDAPDVTFYHRIADALNAFHDLQTFELSGMHWDSDRKSTEGVWQSPAPLESELNSDRVSNVLHDIDPSSDLFFAY